MEYRNKGVGRMTLPRSYTCSRQRFAPVCAGNNIYINDTVKHIYHKMNKRDTARVCGASRKFDGGPHFNPVYAVWWGNLISPQHTPKVFIAHWVLNSRDSPFPRKLGLGQHCSATHGKTLESKEFVLETRPHLHAVANIIANRCVVA